MDKELEELLAKAKAAWEAMTPAGREEMMRAQRRSWVKGELMLEYPNMTEEEAERRAHEAERFVIGGTPHGQG